MISIVGDLTPFKRWNVINTFIKNRNFKSYLEIGTSNFVNFNEIECPVKECVDPNMSLKYTYNMTSDAAFVEIKKQGKTFDIIFIDGLHWSEQVTRDINNSLQVLNPGGIIVLHDCNPPSPIHARWPMPNPVNCPWNGDCFKSIIRYKFKNPMVCAYVIDTDWGVGVIESSKRVENVSTAQFDNIPDNLIANGNDAMVGGHLQLNDKIITWDYFDQHRKELLNMISVEEFLASF